MITRGFTLKVKGEKSFLEFILNRSISDLLHSPDLNKIIASVRKQREANIKIKRINIEMMTELVNVSREVAKFIKSQQLREDEERFI